MKNEKTSTATVGKKDKLALQRPDWSPLNGNITIGALHETKSDGIEIRGCKNTTKGKKARGPMA
jgi:hypothetical protein